MMKKKPYKYLKFYHECMKTGMPHQGLCRCFYGDNLFKLIDPENGHNISFWADDEFDLGREHRCNNATTFGPLRQTIVLFMAAMNNEL